MPHLAPLSWGLAPLFFWLLLFVFVSFLWWSQSPSFPCSKSDSSYKFSHWRWS